MLHAPRHDDELALLQPKITVAQLHQQTAFDHQEELVLLVVLVPDELALQLGQLDLKVVQLAYDARAPALVELRELLRQVDLLDPHRRGSVAAAAYRLPSLPPHEMTNKNPPVSTNCSPPPSS
jgi:hypothetical protein